MEQAKCLRRFHKMQIFSLGTAAIILAVEKNKWGFVLGLLAQPFWFITAIINHQTGVWGGVTVVLLLLGFMVYIGNMKKDLEIDKEKKKRLIAEIKAWFLDNREEEIGDLQAELLVDFLIEKAGAEIYNQALNDALIWLKARFSDMEIDYYSLEKRSRS